MVEAACAAGAKGIVCEKPMAVDLAGCDRMLAAAERSGAVLVVGHQRRLQAKFVRARALIEEGAIGEPELLCGIAGGDLLTDGTHTVDALRFFAGDAEVAWVMGSVDPRPREVREAMVGRVGYQAATPGERFTTRYGHAVKFRGPGDPVLRGRGARLARAGRLRPPGVPALHPLRHRGHDPGQRRPPGGGRAARCASGAREAPGAR